MSKLVEYTLISADGVEPEEAGSEPATFGPPDRPV